MIRQTFMGFCLMLMTYQGVSAETLVPFKWDAQPIRLSLPESFEEEEISSTTIFGYTAQHEITVEEFKDKKSLQNGVDVFLKKKLKDTVLKNLPT